MSSRQRRLAHVTGFVALVLSLAAVTSTLSTGRGQAPSTPQASVHIFVPTEVTLPARDDNEPVSTF